MRLIKSAVRGNHYTEILRSGPLSDQTKAEVKRIARRQQRARERQFFGRSEPQEMNACFVDQMRGNLRAPRGGSQREA